MNILHLSLDLGLGGTEKSMQIFSKYLKKRGHKIIVVGFENSGPRHSFFSNNNIKVYILKGNLSKLKRLIKREQIDIVHIHRSNNAVLKIIKFLKENTSVKIVETNQFGKISSSCVESYVDMRLFVSQFCAMRYLNKNHLPIDAFFIKNFVLYNPLDFDEVYSFTPKEIAQYKNKIGVGSNDFIIGKYGRKDRFKSGDICIDMLPYLVKRLPNIKYLYIGLTDDLKEKAIRLGVYNHIFELPSINNPKELSLFLSSIDVLAHSSLIGESFGLVYSESMAHKKPIVTNSTPYADNAQLELIQTYKNGIIANTPQLFSNAIYNLANNKRLYAKISHNNYLVSKEYFDAAMLTKELENIYKITLGIKKRNSFLEICKLKKFIEYYRKEATLLKKNLKVEELFFFFMYYLKKKYISYKQKSVKNDYTR